MIAEALEPHGSSLELELGPNSELLASATVFLRGARCPFSCTFCDLGRYTTPEATPEGALPAQIDRALADLERRCPEELGRPVSELRQIKLYNASNFFDDRAVPRSDWGPLAERLGRFERVVVESHPRMLRGVDDLAALIPGTLEIAMGLETAHPEAFRRLEKGIALEDFVAIATDLATRHPVRLFLLLGVPHVAREDQVEWVGRSVETAASIGASCVSLIPLRPGTAPLDALRRRGQWQPPDLDQVEHAFREARARAARRGSSGAGAVRVQVDPWDLRQLAGCEACRTTRLEQLEFLNLNPLADSTRLGCRCRAGAESTAPD